MFMDSLVLYQNPSEYAYLLDRYYVHQNQWEEVSAVASSMTMEAKGGFKNIYSEHIKNL